RAQLRIADEYVQAICIVGYGLQLADGWWCNATVVAKAKLRSFGDIIPRKQFGEIINAALRHIGTYPRCLQTLPAIWFRLKTQARGESFPAVLVIQPYLIIDIGILITAALHRIGPVYTIGRHFHIAVAGAF